MVYYYIIARCIRLLLYAIKLRLKVAMLTYMAIYAFNDKLHACMHIIVTVCKNML